MPALRRKLNHRHIELRAIPTHEHVGVLKRTGGYRFEPWLGFIHTQQAKALEGAKPVRLQVVSYSASYGIDDDWQDVPPGQHVQGCLVSHGVYAVLHNGKPRLV